MTEATASITKHCAGHRKDGQPCGVTMLADGSFCFAHSPERTADRADARQRGGKGRSTASRLSKLMPARLVPVFIQLEEALSAVLSGDLDPRKAGAAASVARALVALQQAGEVEERLRRLEGKDGA